MWVPLLRPLRDVLQPRASPSHVFSAWPTRLPLSSSKRYTGFMRNLSPPLQFECNDRHNLLQVNKQVLVGPPSVALTPNKLSKHDPLWQTLHRHTFYESRKQYTQVAVQNSSQAENQLARTFLLYRCTGHLTSPFPLPAGKDCVSRFRLCCHGSLEQVFCRNLCRGRRR